MDISCYSNGIFTIIGVIIGAFLTYILNNLQIQKKIKGVRCLLKAETNESLILLSNFFVNNLNNDYEFNSLNEAKKRDINKFFYNLDDFPNLKRDKWNQLIEYLPISLSEEEIKQINLFWYDIQELCDLVEKLNHKQKPKYYSPAIIEVEIILVTEDIFNARNTFRKKLMNTIAEGEKILKFF